MSALDNLLNPDLSVSLSGCRGAPNIKQAASGAASMFLPCTVLELPLICPAVLPRTGDNELNSQLTEHLRQTRSGRAITVVLDALWIVA
jgi:hypothetical protein